MHTFPHDQSLRRVLYQALLDTYLRCGMWCALLLPPRGVGAVRLSVAWLPSHALHPSPIPQPLRLRA
jgi:hypothetical protein